MALNIAVVGCTGMGGRKFLQVLEERKVEANYYLFASSKSAGTQIDFMGKTHTVIELCKENVVDKKVIYTLYKPNSLNKDLRVFDMNDGSDVLIEDNIALHLVFHGKHSLVRIQIVQPEAFEPQVAGSGRDEVFALHGFEHDLPDG